jgi:hypothetical protein
MAFMRNHTHRISDFRKQNPSGLKAVQTLCFFKDADLITVKSSLLMEPKAERTTVRKPISIKN